MALALRRNRAFMQPYAAAAPLLRRAAYSVVRRMASGAVKRRLVDNRSSAQAEPVSSAPLTGHYDYKTDYRKRRLTRRRRRVIRRRRKWTRRVVKAIRENAIGSSHIIRRSFAPDVAAAAASSASVSWMMYGLNGANDPNLNTTNDIGQSMFEATGPDWTNWESTTVSSVNHKIHSYHATMEFTMVNTGVNDALVEVYYIRARRREAAAWLSPNNVFNQGFLKQKETREPDTGRQVGTELTPTELGVTPFQNALFCRMFNIYKRQKFRVPVGGEISFVMHDRRPRTFTLGGTKPFAWDRGASGVFVQFQGVATGGGVPSPATPALMSFNVTRRYRFKFARDDTATDGRN